jgi:hypothetical protein
MLAPLLGGLPIFALSIMGQPPADPVAKPPAPAPASAPKSDADAPTGLATLSIDELITRLPPAGSEWRWDSKTSAGTEHPASIEMSRRIAIDGSALSDEQWRTVLLTTKAIRYRERWPRDEEYLLSLASPRWLGSAEVRFTPRIRGLRAATVGHAFPSMCGTMTMMDSRDARQGRRLGVLPADTSEVVFDVAVERGGRSTYGWSEKDSQHGKSAILWKGTLTLPVRLVDSFNKAIPPAGGDAVDKGVRDAVGAGFRSWGDDQSVPYLVIDPDDAAFPALEGVGLDIKAELLRDGKPIAESWLIAMDADGLSLMNSRSKSTNRSFGSANFTTDENPKDLASWSIRLTGSSEHVWALWNAKKRWSGTIIIPWNDAVAHEKERTGPEGRGPEVSTPHWK